MRDEIEALCEEITRLKAENDRLREENDRLRAELRAAVDWLGSRRSQP